jgi:hypothetical protein
MSRGPAFRGAPMRARRGGFSGLASKRMKGGGIWIAPIPFVGGARNPKTAAGPFGHIDPCGTWAQFFGTFGQAGMAAADKTLAPPDRRRRRGRNTPAKISPVRLPDATARQTAPHWPRKDGR